MIPSAEDDTGVATFGASVVVAATRSDVVSPLTRVDVDPDEDELGLTSANGTPGTMSAGATIEGESPSR